METSPPPNPYEKYQLYLGEAGHESSPTNNLINVT